VLVEALAAIGFLTEVDEDRVAVRVQPEAAGIIVAVALAVVGCDAGKVEAVGGVGANASGHYA
jgi:hypothetical protein